MFFGDRHGSEPVEHEVAHLFEEPAQAGTGGVLVGSVWESAQFYELLHVVS